MTKDISSLLAAPALSAAAATTRPGFKGTGDSGDRGTSALGCSCSKVRAVPHICGAREEGTPTPQGGCRQPAGFNTWDPCKPCAWHQMWARCARVGTQQLPEASHPPGGPGCTCLCPGMPPQPCWALSPVLVCPGPAPARSQATDQTPRVLLLLLLLG